MCGCWADRFSLNEAVGMMTNHGNRSVASFTYLFMWWDTSVVTHDNIFVQTIKTSEIFN